MLMLINFASNYATLNINSSRKLLKKHCYFYSYLFRAFDSNGNGYIDFTGQYVFELFRAQFYFSISNNFIEFLIPISVTARGSTKEKLEMAFRMFDIDKNNVIDKKEMEKLILIIYDLTGEADRKGMNEPIIKVIQVMNQLGI